MLIKNDTLIVNWVTKNIGNIETNSKSWTDRILIASTNGYKQQIDFIIEENMSPSEKLTFERNLSLPSNIYGNLSITLTIDVNGLNYSQSSMTNKTFTQILLKPKPQLADLVPNSLQCSLNYNESLIFLLCKWVVLNNESSMNVYKNWTDTIQLISTKNNQIYQQQSFPLSYKIYKYEGYEQTKLFLISSTTNCCQNLKAILFVDYNQNVIELNEGNNQIESIILFNSTNLIKRLIY